MTDVKTGWTVHFALLNKASVWVIQTLDKAFSLLPIGLKGIHSDAGSEFINKPLDPWRQRHGVAFSRGRPTRKR
jgi:transposase InsO family protein